MVLSYRHAFVAGGYSDVFKHALLIAFLRRCSAAAGDFLPPASRPDLASRTRTKSLSPTSLDDLEDEGTLGNELLYVDTHAGPGRYDLAHPLTIKAKEYRNGIEKLLFVWRQALRESKTNGNARSELLSNEDLNSYINIVQAYNQDAQKTLRYYIGSPLIASEYLEQKGVSGKRVFHELHGREFVGLRKTFDKKRWFHQTNTFNSDGLGVMATRSTVRRFGPTALFIDPSYEGSFDYENVPKSLRWYSRKPGLSTMLWYPFLQDKDQLLESMVGSLKKMPDTQNWVNLIVKKPTGPTQSDGKFRGLGLFFHNCQKEILNDCKSLAPIIARVLGGDISIESSFSPNGRHVASEPGIQDLEKKIIESNKEELHKEKKLKSNATQNGRFLKKGKPIRFL